MSDPTPEHVRAFADHMAHRFRASIVDKRSAGAMVVVAAFVDRMGVVDQARFQERFATTVGRTIFLPFEPGVPTPAWPLWTQMVVLTHECQHIVQYDRLGPWTFGLRYLTQSGQRAVLEAEAYRCQLELYHWKTGGILAAKLLAASLKSYAVTDADLRVAEAMLASSAISVKRGATLTEAGRVALDWLDAFAPELRG